MLTLSHEHSRLRAVEPGVSLGSNLGDLPAAARAIAKALAPALVVLPHFTTSQRREGHRPYRDRPVERDRTYADENGDPLQPSKQVSDLAFSDRYIAESRALLATVPD